MIIRREKSGDIDGIHILNELAFGQPQEADVVDKLRNVCPDIFSLVAVENKKIVGHVFFSPATIEGPHGLLEGAGLAPIAVMPGMQRKGIGTQLIKKGIEHYKKCKCPYIIVLGHPEYYPRSGFERASKYGVRCQWNGIPDAAFMILWLDKESVPPVSGLAKYRDEFNEAM